MWAVLRDALGTHDHLREAQVQGRGAQARTVRRGGQVVSEAADLGTAAGGPQLHVTNFGLLKGRKYAM